MEKNIIYGVVLNDNQPYIITMLSDMKIEDVGDEGDFYIGKKTPGVKGKTVILFSPDDCDFENVKIAKFYGKE